VARWISFGEGIVQVDSLAAWLEGGTPSPLEPTLLLAFAMVVVDLALAAIAFAAAREMPPANREAEAP